MLEPAAVLILVAMATLAILMCFKVTRRFICGVIAVALLIVVACAVQNTARAEGVALPSGFYYRITFVDEIEKAEKEDVIHADDLDNLWDFYEDYSDIEFATNENLNEFAKSFAKVNTLWFTEETTNPVIVGRIIVLTMWEANLDNALDDEIIDVYYSKFITDVR